MATRELQGTQGQMVHLDHPVSVLAVMPSSNPTRSIPTEGLTTRGCLNWSLPAMAPRITPALHAKRFSAISQTCQAVRDDPFLAVSNMFFYPSVCLNR